ncbi:sodium-dependent noradrenaline transporter isoform X1 [Octopus bimaculoides]|uniref:sodium-dependent noradrenaline transporter isoform X1 n=1 Tax=Octopus bimaculoides TaxID=37653 RepID=UPI0022E202B6|nr:sodium-dependent noradrenaline transporter isoform X1 [Octopus bimaculoides]
MSNSPVKDVQGKDNSSTLTAPVSSANITKDPSESQMNGNDIELKSKQPILEASGENSGSNGPLFNPISKTGTDTYCPEARTGCVSSDGEQTLIDKDVEKTICLGPSHVQDTTKRETWGGTIDFLLSIIGFAVDLANVWRFPYLCYRNGGGAFLIPYFSVLLLLALPLFFMELVLGQFHRQGPITVWRMVPLFKGVGYASCFMSYIVAFYYNIVIGWSFFYLFNSFSASLPWMTCNNEWNTKDCWQLDWFNDTAPPENVTYNPNTSVSSTTEFFERETLSLHHSSGIDDLGYIKWQLALCTLSTFIILYFSLWKGVKSSGKVVYITATLPYIVLAILLIRGVMLPGAAKGVRYFITPNTSRLGDLQVWIDAAVQIYFSVGAGFGVHIAYASYNKFKHNCYRDCLITAVINSFTSIFSGFVIFSYLGYMAFKTNKDISEVATEGPGLVFIVYPEAISTLPGSTAWSILFFLMLLTLGLDSAFGGLESPLTGLKDELKRFFVHKYSREIFTLIVVGSAYLFSLPCVTTVSDNYVMISKRCLVSVPVSTGGFAGSSLLQFF